MMYSESSRQVIGVYDGKEPIGRAIKVDLWRTLKMQGTGTFPLRLVSFDDAVPSSLQGEYR